MTPLDPTAGRADALRLVLFQLRDAREVTAAAGFKLKDEAKAKLYDIQQDIIRSAIAADDRALTAGLPSSAPVDPPGVWTFATANARIDAACAPRGIRPAEDIASEFFVDTGSTKSTNWTRLRDAILADRASRVDGKAGR